MLLKLKEPVWAKLQHLTLVRGKSAASIVAEIVEEYLDKKVKTQFKTEEEIQNNG